MGTWCFQHCLSSWLRNLIEGDVWMIWIINQIIIKIGSLKIDDGGATMMCSDAIYNQTTYSKLNNFLWLYCVRTHHCFSTVINFKATKFQHSLVYDSIYPNVTFYRIHHVIWHCYNHQTVTCQIFILHN